MHNYSKTGPLLLFAIGLLLTACGGIDPIHEPQGGPSLQGIEQPPGNGGGGPCLLDEYTASYRVAATYAPAMVGYDFAVKLVAQDSCRASFEDPKHCKIRHGQINFSFPNDVGDPTPVRLDEFEDIVAYDYLHPNTKTVWEGLTENGLSVEGNSVIHFKWYSEMRHDLPAENRLSAGGICIPGVITEPCPQCPPQSRPLRPFIQRPRRLR